MFDETIRIPCKRCSDCHKVVPEEATLCFCNLFAPVYNRNFVQRFYESVKVEVRKRWELAS